MPSTSVNDGDFVGLHVDSWGSPNVSTRADGYPTRMCINLGPEERYLQFMNISLFQMKKILGSDSSDDPNDFVVEFMAKHPEYPVYRASVMPGEGYLAPTEIIIHDATTEGKNMIDASFTILGDFCPNFEQFFLERVLELGKKVAAA